MSVAVTLYDFEDARKLLASAEQEDGFAVVVVSGPRFGGKTRLLREYLTPGRPELVLDIDLKRVTGVFELVKLIVTRAEATEFGVLRQDVYPLLETSTSFERSKIVNSQLIIDNQLTPERLEMALALSLSEDLTRLRRKLILAFDNTYACDRELASTVYTMVDAMRTHRTGLVIFEQVIRDPRLAMLEDGRGRTELDAELFADPNYAILLPRFEPYDVERFAAHLGIGLDAAHAPLIAQTSAGVPGLIELFLKGLANGH